MVWRRRGSAPEAGRQMFPCMSWAAPKCLARGDDGGDVVMVMVAAMAASFLPPPPCPGRTLSHVVSLPVWPPLPAISSCLGPPGADLIIIPGAVTKGTNLPYRLPPLPTFIPNSNIPFEALLWSPAPRKEDWGGGFAWTALSGSAMRSRRPLLGRDG